MLICFEPFHVPLYDVPRLEAEINNLICKLYGLTDKETVIIEGKSG